MVEIVAKIWLNIDSFSYPKILSVDHNDIANLKKSRRNSVIYPSLTFILCFMVSKNRISLLSKLRNSILSDKKSFYLDLVKYNSKKKNQTIVENKSSDFEKKIRDDLANVNPKPINEYKETESTSNYKEYVPTYDPDAPTFIPEARKLSSRSEPYKPKEYKDTRMNKLTFSQEFAPNSGLYNNNIKEAIIPMKKRIFSSMYTKENLTLKIDKFIRKSRLVYLPVVFALIIVIQQLMLDYAAFYLKYQPLVDRYQKFLDEKSEKINKI